MNEALDVWFLVLALISSVLNEFALPDSFILYATVKLFDLSCGILQRCVKVLCQYLLESLANNPILSSFYLKPKERQQTISVLEITVYNYNLQKEIKPYCLVQPFMNFV